MLGRRKCLSKYTGGGGQSDFSERCKLAGLQHRYMSIAPGRDIVKHTSERTQKSGLRFGTVEIRSIKGF